jgi:hypothetical protein
MARKIIIGVIGATHRRERPVPEEVLDLARGIGQEIGGHNAILLTGGRPAEQDCSVKSYAMLGCAAVRENGLLSGRMISVLPEGPLGVDGVPGTRRVGLRTTLSPMGRNPITGGVPDRLIVLRGGVGTLVELAFALRPDDIVPTVFARSLEYLRQQNTQNRDQILVNIRDARTKYGMDGQHGLPDVDATVLHNALSAQLALIPACGDIDSCAHVPCQSKIATSHWTVRRFCNG